MTPTRGFSVLFWEKVNKTADCWLWMGAQIPKNGFSYGFFQNQRAHRVSYKLSGGNIPKGMEIDHLCKNTLCVRPTHLEPVTHKENVLRGNSPSAVHSRKTTAVCGHPYDAFDGRRRYCKPCRIKWMHQYHVRRKVS